MCTVYIQECSLRQVTAPTLPGAYLFIVAGMALLNSILLFTVRWGMNKADSLRELDNEANQRPKEEEDLLKKEGGQQRKQSWTEHTNVTREYKRIVSKET